MSPALELLPKCCLPSAAEPLPARVEEAARAICDALAEDRFGRQFEGDRVIEAYSACAAFPRTGQQEPSPSNHFRWAVRRMVETGLLKVVVVKHSPPQPEPGDVFVRPEPERDPEYYLQATPELWDRWQTGAPILGLRGAGSSSLPGATPPIEKPIRPHWDKDLRTLYFGDRIVRRYRAHPAPSQITILEAFEACGWSPSIPPPEAIGNIRDTLSDLNQSLGKDAPIRFGGDGTGKAIIWEPVN